MRKYVAFLRFMRTILIILFLTELVSDRRFHAKPSRRVYSPHILLDRILPSNTPQNSEQKGKRN